MVREILVDLQEESNNKRDERLDPEATGGGFVFLGGSYCRNGICGRVNNSLGWE